MKIQEDISYEKKERERENNYIKVEIEEASSFDLILKLLILIKNY
jgi:hypothetical protein